MSRRDNCVCKECKARRYRKAILAGWEWLKEQKLDHLLEDPWADGEVIAYLNQFYNSGFNKFCSQQLGYLVKP